MTFLKTAFAAAVVALVAVSSASAMKHKSGNQGYETVTTQISAPSSRTAQEKLNW